MKADVSATAPPQTPAPQVSPAAASTAMSIKPAATTKKKETIPEKITTKKRAAVKEEAKPAAPATNNKKAGKSADVKPASAGQSQTRDTPSDTKTAVTTTAQPPSSTTDVSAPSAKTTPAGADQKRAMSAQPKIQRPPDNVPAVADNSTTGSDNETKKRVTMASIVANAVATDAFNKQKVKTPRKALASAAKKVPEPKFGERPEVGEAFSTIKKNPAMAEMQFRALLKACGHCERSINTLTEGLARAIMRQGKQRCAEAERILRELQTKFTGTTPQKLKQAVNLTLANALINQGKHSQAQSLLLSTMELVDPERTDMDEQTALITPCGQQRIDQAMVQAHLGKSHYHKARTLLLAIMADLRPPEQHHLSEEELLQTLCGDNELDVIMSRILEKQHRFAEARALLLAIMDQCPVKRQQRLPSNPVLPLPCADQVLNMNLFRLLSESDNDQQARLFILQTMAMKEPARYQLEEDQALLTPCNDQKLNLALVRHLQKEGNRTAAIQLLTAIMHAPGQSPAITPCDNSDLNFSMLKLLEEEHRLAEAETFLLRVMNTYRPKNQRSLPAALAITTPCGFDTWDLAMVRLLINRKSLPEAEAMMRRIVAQHRPEHQRTLSPSVVDAIPCGNEKLDLQMAKVLCQRHKYKLAESLLLALMHTFRPRCQADLPREEALITACGNNEADLAMVFLQEERENFDTAISLMLSSMAGHRSRRQREQLSPGQAMQTPCLRHEHNMTLLRLLGKAGKKEATRQLLLAIMTLNRAHNQADLPSDEALSTPCGYSEVDRTAAITLLELNEQEKSVNLVLAMMQPHRPQQQQALPRDQAMTTPCPVPSLNQLLFTTLAYREDTHPAAEKLMLTMMKSYPLNPRRTVHQLKFTPCSNYTMNMSMIMLLSKKGDIAGAKQLLLATMNIYRPHDQRQLPDHLAQITPCHKHDLDLKMVIILENEKQYQQARLMLLAMMKIDPTATATAHGPCGSPLLDTAMLRLLAAAGPEDQHNELINACLKRYPEDPSFLIHHLINLCRQHKWADYDQQIGRLRPSIQRELSISIRFFTEALHCFLAGDQSKGQDLCTRAYHIADRALQKSPQNSSLLSHKAHCARILGHPSGEYLPLFDQARMLDPNRERTEKDDHWRSDENRVIELLGV